MSAINWQDVHYTESDRVIWEEDLEAFVPQRIFDAHIHLWNPEALAPDSPHHASRFAADMTLTEEWNRRMFPGRTFDYLVLGMPTPGIDVASHNAFMARELASHPNSRANRLVTPQCRPEDIAADIRKLGFMGLKPYRIYSVTGDTHRCRIHEFLTHPQLEVANELGDHAPVALARVRRRREPPRPRGVHDAALPEDQVDPRPLRPQLHVLGDPRGGRPPPGSPEHLV
jgi:hypothetical protein